MKNEGIKKLIGMNVYSVSPYEREEEDEGYGDADAPDLLKCRYVQCGFFENDLFSGIISDYQGAGVYATEYWVNGVCLEYDTEDELFFQNLELGSEIQNMFQMYVNEEDSTVEKEDFYNCFEDVDNKGEFFQLKSVAKIKPISSHKGLTNIISDEEN